MLPNTYGETGLFAVMLAPDSSTYRHPAFSAAHETGQDESINVHRSPSEYVMTLDTANVCLEDWDDTAVVPPNLLSLSQEGLGS